MQPYASHNYFHSHQHEHHTGKQPKRYRTEKQQQWRHTWASTGKMSGSSSLTVDQTKSIEISNKFKAFVGMTTLIPLHSIYDCRSFVRSSLLKYSNIPTCCGTDADWYVREPTWFVSWDASVPAVSNTAQVYGLHAWMYVYGSWCPLIVGMLETCCYSHRRHHHHKDRMHTLHEIWNPWLCHVIIIIEWGVDIFYMYIGTESKISPLEIQGNQHLIARWFKVTLRYKP